MGWKTLGIVVSGQRRNKRHKSIETSHSVGTVQLHVTVLFVWFHVLKYSVFRLLRMSLTSLNLFDMSWRSLSCIKSAKRVCMAMTAALPFAGSFGATAPGKIVHEASSYHGTRDERFGGGNPQSPHAISASVKLVRC